MLNRWGILGLVALGQTTNALVGQGLPTLFAFLQADFQLSRAEVGLFLSAIQGGTVVTFIVGGWAADALGIRRVVPVAQLLVAAAAFAFSLVASFPQGLAVLLVAGIAFGVVNPALTLAVLMWFPVRGRATAMGIKQTGGPIAGVLTAALLPSLGLLAGWRTSFVLLSTASLVSAALAALLYRDPPDARPLGVIPGPSWRQVRALARQRELLLLSLFAAVLIADQFVIVGYLILYLREHLGLSVVVGGLVLALAQLGAFVGRIAWGVFSDVTLRGRRVPGLAMAGGAAAVLLVGLALLPPAPSIWLLAPLAFSLGFSAIGWHGLRQALVPELVPRQIAGMALGVSQTLAEAGPIFGPPLFGALADAAGYRVAWLVMAGLTVVVSWTLWRGLDERRARSAAALPAHPPAPAPAEEVRPGYERR
ncbi:MAG: MFS transporter [Chloroflexi bacterium]|nr:MFS transporter [Chloroflexota bacterium]